MYENRTVVELKKIAKQRNIPSYSKLRKSELIKSLRKQPTKRKSSGRGLQCNKPKKSWRKNKKRVVKACSKGKEKIVHYGDSRYRHNYSPKARKSFHARHKCAQAKDKLSARYWACHDLW